jgi:hypothetical protein
MRDAPTAQQSIPRVPKWTFLLCLAAMVLALLAPPHALAESFSALGAAKGKFQS